MKKSETIIRGMILLVLCAVTLFVAEYFLLYDQGIMPQLFGGLWIVTIYGIAFWLIG